MLGRSCSDRAGHSVHAAGVFSHLEEELVDRQYFEPAKSVDQAFRFVSLSLSHTRSISLCLCHSDSVYASVSVLQREALSLGTNGHESRHPVPGPQPRSGCSASRCFNILQHVGEVDVYRGVVDRG